MRTFRAIDVSKWNGNYKAGPIPNYANLVTEGVTLCIHKASQSENCDAMFSYGIGECARLSIPWTAYHFWEAGDTRRTAKAFAILAKGASSGLPLVVDFEPPDSVPASAGTKLFEFLLAVEQESSQKPWIYTGAPYWNRFFPTPPFWQKDYKLWVAAYPKKKTSWTPENQWEPNSYSYITPTLPIGWTYSQLVMWQFCEKGDIVSFGKSVDLDWYYPDGFVPPAETGEYPKEVRITAQPNLRVREHPSQAAAVVGRVAYGAMVSVLDEQDGWGRINSPMAGWISLAYTTPAH